jgi:hypothetical protein
MPDALHPVGCNAALPMPGSISRPVARSASTPCRSARFRTETDGDYGDFVASLRAAAAPSETSRSASPILALPRPRPVAQSAADRRPCSTRCDEEHLRATPPESPSPTWADRMLQSPMQ